MESWSGLARAILQRHRTAVLRLKSGSPTPEGIPHLTSDDEITPQTLAIA
jgi:hypothetical protein